MPVPIDLTDLIDDPEAFVELAALLGVLTRDEVEQLVGGAAPEQAERRNVPSDPTLTPR